MKTSLALLFGVIACAGLAGQGIYPDRPKGLTVDQAAIIQSYEEQARKMLPQFDEELQSANGRTFFVVTKIHDGALFEQVYVRVGEKKGNAYRGRIASTPMGPVKFERNALIDVLSNDVADWCIVQANGEEQGNITGKALDALQVGKVVFIISVKPKNGQYAGFKVVEVRNPKTQQVIGEIVPDETIRFVEREATTRFSKLKADDDKEKFQFILTSFPGWKIIP